MGYAQASLRLNQRLMVGSAGAMFGAAALDGLIGSVLPGDPPYPPEPIIAVTVLTAVILVTGRWWPRWALASLGPLGVALVAFALSTAPGANDGALLYALPVLWTSFFFGLPGTIAIVAWVAIAQTGALLVLPASSSYPGRWIDVMVAVSSVAAVVCALQRRNDRLLGALEREARTDALTGLLNRRGLQERAALELPRAGREGRPIALLLYDIDHFKRINDRWGHEIGDRVLARLGELLGELARGTDVVARVGGEEFLIMLPGAGEPEARALDERLRAALTVWARTEQPVVEVSAGLTVFETPAELETMVRAADAALYDAKRMGRNRTVPAAVTAPAAA